MGVPLKRAALLSSIFLFALVLRSCYLHEYSRSPHWDLLTLDTEIHDLLAREISEKDFFGNHPFFRAPLYPYLLGLVYAFFGPTLLIPRIIQILCGAFSCVLLYLIGERLFRPAVGLWASLAACIYWVFIYFEGELLLVAIYVFLLLLALYLAVLSNGRNLKRLAAAGFVLGLATITRPNVLVFYPVLLLWLWLAGFKTKRDLCSRAAALFLPPLLIIGCVTLRNCVLGKDSVFIAYQAGVNFYIGNNEDSTGHAAQSPYNVTRIPDSYKWKHRDNVWINDDVWLSGYYLAEREAGRDLKPSEVQSYWFQKAFASISDNKWTWTKLFLKKVYYFLNAYEIPSNRNPYLFIRDASPLLRTLSFLDFGMIVSCGLLGMLVSMKRIRELLLLHGFVVTYGLTNIAFFINTRYRIPAIPLFILFAVFFLFWLAEKTKAKKYAAAFPAVLACGGLLYVSHTEWFGLKDKVLESILHYNLATALMEKEEYAAAAKEYEKSIRLNPDEIHVAYENLCALHIQTGAFDDAVEWARRGMAKFPKSRKLHAHLGTAYLRMGKLDEAIAEFEDLLEKDPGNEVASLNLGLAYYDAGRMEEATRRFEKTLDVLAENPRIHIVAHLHLGFIALKAGKPEAAKARFEEVLKLDPHHPEAIELLNSIELKR